MYGTRAPLATSRQHLLGHEYMGEVHGGQREACLARGDAPAAALPRGDAHRSAYRIAGVDAQRITFLRGQEGLRRNVACELTRLHTTDGHSRRVIDVGDGAV